MSLLELLNVKKVFNVGRPNEFVALRGVSFNIATGTTVVLKGPSGSGKTTLLSLLGCMARPTSGRIMLRNREMTSLPERFLASTRRSSFGFIFQQYNLIRGLSAIENVICPALPAGEERHHLKARALMLLETFGLSPKADTRIEWLSGGELQRVAIARALINNPAVIVADEPTAHLDSTRSLEFMEAMQRLTMDGRTVIIASHDPLVYESSGIDRIIEMRDGLVVA